MLSETAGSSQQLDMMSSHLDVIYLYWYNIFYVQFILMLFKYMYI